MDHGCNHEDIELCETPSFGGLVVTAVSTVVPPAPCIIYCSCCATLLHRPLVKRRADCAGNK